jgi:hypothetical protein
VPANYQLKQDCFLRSGEIVIEGAGVILLCRKGHYEDVELLYSGTKLEESIKTLTKST